MREIKYIVTDPEGIHARPAGLLVKKTKEFASDIHLIKDGKSVDAKRLLSIMGLGVKNGQEISLTVEGADEDTAIAALEEFLKAEL